MSERRLLILCYFYPPLAGGGVHRVLGFTRHLPESGWQCTVICAGDEDYWVNDETLEVPPGTEVVRVGGGSALSAWLKLGGRRRHGRRSGSVFGPLRQAADWWLLPDSYAGWARRARQVAARRLGRGDVDALLSTSPPDSVHLAAAGLGRRFGVPWIADFRDPWIGLHFRTPPTSWHRERHRALERRVLTEADLVLTASRLHAQDVARVGVRQVNHLPNGFEPVATAATAPVRDDDRFSIVFTGTVSLMPDTETFLEALHEVLMKRPEARRRLRATIAGPFDVGYQDRSIALGLTPGIVEFTGPLPHARTRALQESADVLVLWKPRGPGYRTMVPGKLYEYLDAGRPLIALLDEADEAADLVRRADGTRVAPGDRVGLAQAIDGAYAAWREGRRTSRARPEWIDEHTRSRLAGRLAATLDGMIGARS